MTRSLFTVSLALLILFSNSIVANTWHSGGVTAGGNWSNANSWLEGGGFPISGDIAIITSGNPITVDVASTCATLTINSGGAVTASNSLTLTGTFTNNGGTYTANSFGLTVGGGWANNGGTFVSGTSTVTFNGSVQQNLFNSGGSETFSKLVSASHLLNVQIPITVNSDLTVNSGGNLDCSGANNTFTVKGNFIQNGTFTVRSGKVNMNGSGGQIINTADLSAVTFFNLQISNTAGTVQLGAPINVDGDLTIGAAPATLNSASNRIDFYGNWINNGGTFTPGTGLVVERTPGAANIGKVGGGTETFYQLQITTGTMSMTSNITVSNILTISGGTLNGGASGFNLTVGSNWENSGGTFTPGNSTVIFNGSVTQNLFKTTAPETFANLTLNSGNTLNTQVNITVSGALLVSSGKVDVSGANSSIFVGGNLTFNGTGSLEARSGTVTLNGASAQSIGGTATPTYNNLTITNSSTITMTGALNIVGNFITGSGLLDAGVANNQISVKGNLTFNGTLNPELGTVLLNGSTAQTVTAPGTLNFYNLTLSNSAGASFTSGTYTITNSITSTSGTLAQAGSSTFTLLSTAANTAFVGNSSGSFSGSSFTVQRFITSRTKNWQDMGVCGVAGSSLYTSWDTQMIISGIGGIHGVSCCPDFFSMNTWNEAGNALVPVKANITPLLAGTGYEMWFQGSGANWPSTTLSNSGSLVTGNQSPPITFHAGTNAGENIIANPYPAHVDWNLVSRTNVSTTCYILSAGAYVAHNTGAQVDIPAGQGIVVYATSGSPSITFHESSKIVSGATSDGSNWGRDPAPYNLKFKLSGQGIPAIADFYQEVMVAFNEQTTLGYEDGQDYRFVKSPETTAPALCLIQNGMRLTRDAFSSNNNETVTIPMKATVGTDGDYLLSCEGAYSMSEYSCALLEDLQKHTIIDLKNKPNYYFTAATTDSPDRFVLHLSRDASTCERVLASVKPAADLFFTDNQVAIFEYNNMATIQFDLDQGTVTSVNICDITGRRVAQDLNVDAYKQTLNIDLSGEASGLYLVSVNLGGNHVVTKKILINH